MSPSHARFGDEVAMTAEVRALLERRAERLRARTTPPEEEAVLWVADLPLGGERYAVPLADLRAAVPLKAVTPVPLAAPHVLGVVRFQGQAIAALGLATMLRAKPAAPSTVLLVVSVGGERLVAIDAERVPGPTGLPLARVEAARAFAPDAAVLPVTTADLETVHLLDLARLLERVRGGRDAR